jgi:hypothetical protein
MTVERFLIVRDVIDKESQLMLSHAPKPSCLCRAYTPETLDYLTFGEYLDLKRIKTDEDVLCIPAQVVLKQKLKHIMKADVRDVFGFSRWVIDEVVKINKMFSEINQAATPEERAAGIERLQFGDFGMIDWYAQRMRIQDHDDVLKLPWRRIYQVMKNDGEIAAYRKRLEKEYNKKSK